MNDTDDELLRVIGARYPHVANKLRLVLFEPEAEAVFDDLLVDCRGGRSGFHLDAFQAIVKLREMHKFKSETERSKFF